MPTQRDIFDEVVRRRISLERYSSTQVRVILRYLTTVEKDLVGRIAAAMIDGTSTFTQEQTLQSVRELYRDAYNELRAKLNRDFEGLAEAEAEFRNRLLVQAQTATNVSGAVVTGQFATLSAAQAYAVAVAKPMQGKLLKLWTDEMSARHLAGIEQAIKIGFTEGESMRKIVARVREVSTLNKRGAQAIVRTANTHISAAVSQESYRINKKYISGWQFMATLDSRTTLECAGLDGSVHPVGKGPFPPRHIQCRSSDMPVLMGQEPLPRELYSSWLKRQSKEVQEDILGVERAKLFRSGKVTIDRFTDSKGKTLTLKQLRYK